MNEALFPEWAPEELINEYNREKTDIDSTWQFYAETDEDELEPNMEAIWSTILSHPPLDTNPNSNRLRTEPEFTLWSAINWALKEFKSQISDPRTTAQKSKDRIAISTKTKTLLYAITKDPAAAPFERFLLKEHIDLFDLLKSTPEEITKYQHEAQLDLAATNKAQAILRKGGSKAYEKAQDALAPAYLDWWGDHIDENEYPDTAEGLSQFIREILAPICIRTEYEFQFTAAIKSQILGEGLQADRLENLNRYETHLDRKFERTLAMLLKMKELRGGK